MDTKAIKSRFNKTIVLSSLALSAAFSFTVFFFSPVDVYISNQIEFIVGFDKIIFPMLGVSVLYTGLLMSILVLFLLINETLFNVIKNLIFGSLCAMYLQMLFFNGQMRSLTGADIQYLKNQKVYLYVNYFLFWIITFLPLIIWGIKENKPDFKPLKKLGTKASAFVCLSVILMQLVGSVGLIINYGLNKNSDDYSADTLSMTEALKLSSDKNVVVFLTDRLDSLWMDQELEKYPEVNEILEGFTFYQNNTAVYTNTFPAVAEMLTGYKYNGQMNSDYLTEAWSKHSVMDVFHDNNYRVNLLISGTTTYNSYSDIKNVADNYENIDNYYRINYLDKNGIIPTMTKLSFMKLLPYKLKSFFSDQFKTDFANDFFIVNSDNPCFPFAVGASSDALFYNCLKNNGIKLESDNNTFSFIHLNFAHDHHRELAELSPSYNANEPLTIELCMRGGFEILNEYFKQMKELGIYDTSTIIVLGDHGRPPFAVQEGADKLDEPIITGLLIKEANAEKAPLKIDSDTELSNAYFDASILEYAGIDHSEYGYSYQDIIRKDIHPERIINIYNYNDNKPYLVCLYKITGNARNFDNWQYKKINSGE